MDYAQRIKELMKQKGITNIWEFSRRVDVPGPTIDGLLNRKQRTFGPRIDTIEKICKGLGITIGEFMEEEKTTEESLFSRNKLSDEQIKFLIENMYDPGFVEAIEILRTLPENTRAIVKELCLKHKS